ncbi:protein of unknown function [Marinobacter persicus]|uniref:DUF4124 domain-containing protein n=1 Tax=Marinobacter persicus TaxID=930118 RepID=A0A1I3X376_9GAMM|nr:DUF4124 domain-containing protein [Marinobacter persicus]GHD48477.1 hypothetical protein GCM10008110_17280 [Marinobacter persicus]SFK13769.1 protein of unknown function [Marinobacter persicus]
MNRKILMLAALMAATPALAYGQSVYKWTDEDGVTHFGDRQPSGNKVEQVNIRTSKPSGSGEARPGPQERLNELEKQRQGEQQKREETAVEEARRKQREANCATARSNLEMINRNARIRAEMDGELRYLTPEEIEEQRQKFEDIAEENCNPEETGAER